MNFEKEYDLDFWNLGFAFGVTLRNLSLQEAKAKWAKFPEEEKERVKQIFYLGAEAGQIKGKRYEN